MPTGPAAGASSVHTALSLPTRHHTVQPLVGDVEAFMPGLPWEPLPRLSPPLVLLPFSGQGPLMPSLSEGFNWDGSVIFPQVHPRMTCTSKCKSLSPRTTSKYLPVSPVRSALTRATWFRHHTSSGPGVTVPGPGSSNLCTLLSSSDPQHLAPPKTVCPPHPFQCPFRCSGPSQPSSVLPSTKSSPSLPASPLFLIILTVSTPWQPPYTGSNSPAQLSSFPILNVGGRGFAWNQLPTQGCETSDNLSLTPFPFCEMGMMTGPAPLAEFVL